MTSELSAQTIGPAPYPRPGRWWRENTCHRRDGSVFFRWRRCRAARRARGFDLYVRLFDGPRAPGVFLTGLATGVAGGTGCEGVVFHG